MDDPIREQAIIALYEARDEAAITETAEILGAYCYTVAYNILDSREDAEECVNDTYLAIWNAIPPAKPASFRAFLTRIVRNLALNRYKEQHRDKRGGGVVPMVLEELSEVVSGDDDVPSEYQRRELLDSICAYLMKLSPRDRGIFVGRYLQMETTAALAARFGVKEPQVLLILSRVRKKLRIYLEKEGFTL